VEAIVLMLQKRKEMKKRNLPNRDDVIDRWVSEVYAALL